MCMCLGGGGVREKLMRFGHSREAIVYPEYTKVHTLSRICTLYTHSYTNPVAYPGFYIGGCLIVCARKKFPATPLN